MSRRAASFVAQLVAASAVIAGCSTIAGIKDDYHTVSGGSGAGGSTAGGAAGTGGAGNDAGGQAGVSGGGAGGAGTGGGGAAGTGGSGGAGGTCSGGQTSCGGTCVNTQTDANNCGKCGNKCGTDRSCFGGHCYCNTGGTDCNGTCVDVTSDPNNCGDCGNKCATGVACGAGSCGLEWALWPMPNPPSTGLPNPASYDMGTAGVVLDNVTGLMWQRAIDGKSFTRADARSYCANLTLAGHGDWRVPTAIELYSLVDFTKSKPSIDSTAFPNTPAVEFWSSSLFAGNSGGGWFVQFDYGYVQNGSVTNTFRLRCVRGGQTSSGSRYAAANGTVKDNATGLIWQQAVDSNTYTWSQAKSYCTGLTLAGGGWRAPSVNELMTLFDFGAVSPPTIETTAFPNTAAAEFWSSSTYADGGTAKWIVRFDGTTPATTLPQNPSNPVRCVR